MPGRTITGWFEPTKVGEYDIQCAEMCGIGHGLMKGKLYVHDDAQFSQWLTEERQGIAVADDSSEVAMGILNNLRSQPEIATNLKE